ncbi:unnamed protein product [Rhodiola kirilowii]
MCEEQSWTHKQLLMLVPVDTLEVIVEMFGSHSQLQKIIHGDTCPTMP